MVIAAGGGGGGGGGGGIPQKFVSLSRMHELFMIAMAASEQDETNGEDRSAQECTPLTPEICLRFLRTLFHFRHSIYSY